MERQIEEDGTMILNPIERRRLRRVLGPVEINAKKGEGATVYTTGQIILKRLFAMFQRMPSFPAVSAYLIGGAASHVVNSRFSYSDIDLEFIIHTDSPCGINFIFKDIRAYIQELLASLNNQVKPMEYLNKQFMLSGNSTDGDIWSIFGFNNNAGRHFEMKFVFRLERDYMFSTDSIKIDVTPLNLDVEDTSLPDHIFVSSSFGDLRQALYNLDHCVIDTNEPEKIMGGGFLKYVKLKMNNFSDAKEGKELKKFRGAIARGFKKEFELYLSGCKCEPIAHFLLNHFQPGDYTGKLRYLGDLKAAYLCMDFSPIHMFIPDMNLIVEQEKTKILDKIDEIRKANMNGDTSTNGELAHQQSGYQNGNGPSSSGTYSPY